MACGGTINHLECALSILYNKFLDSGWLLMSVKCDLNALYFQDWWLREFTCFFGPYSSWRCTGISSPNCIASHHPKFIFHPGVELHSNGWLHVPCHWVWVCTQECCLCIYLFRTSTTLHLLHFTLCTEHKTLSATPRVWVFFSWLNTMAVIWPQSRTELVFGC